LTRRSFFFRIRVRCVSRARGGFGDHNKRMATAAAIFGVPCTILEGAGLEPWEATQSHDEAHPDDALDTPGDDLTVNPATEAQEDGDEEAPAVALTDFQVLSVKQLRDLAKVVGVSATGNKAALVERVTTALLPLGMGELPMPFTHLTPWFIQ